MTRTEDYLRKQFTKKNISEEVLTSALAFWENIQLLQVKVDPTNVVTSDEGGIHFAWRVDADWLTADIEADEPNVVNIYCVLGTIDTTLDPQNDYFDWGLARTLCQIFTKMEASMSWATSYIEDLKKGITVTFRPRGHSMTPLILSGQEVTVAPVPQDHTFAKGDIVLCKVNGKQYLHKISALRKGGVQISNNKGKVNGWTSVTQVFGIFLKEEGAA